MPSISDFESLRFFERDDVPFARDPKSWNLFRVRSESQLEPCDSSIFADILQSWREISKSEALKLAESCWPRDTSQAKA